jgi:hypothetical protein
MAYPILAAGSETDSQPEIRGQNIFSRDESKGVVAFVVKLNPSGVSSANVAEAAMFLFIV